jgi:WD40 repeat protein
MSSRLSLMKVDSHRPSRGNIMAADWYYKTATNREEGPFTPAGLKRLASERRIRPNTMVRKGMEGQWVPASKVKGLVDGETSTAIAPGPVVRSTPSVLVSRAPEDGPEVYTSPVPLLPSKSRDVKDGESRDVSLKHGRSPALLIGIGVGAIALLIIGLIVLVISLSGNSDGAGQNTAVKPSKPGPADEEQQRQAQMDEDQRSLQEEQKQKAKEALARKEEERRELRSKAGREVRQFLGTDAYFNAVAFSRDGRYVGGVCVGQASPPFLSTDFGDTSVYVWQASTGKQLHRFTPKPLDSIFYRFTSIDFSPDGSLVASGREDGTIHVWDVASGTEIHLLARPNLGDSRISEHVDAIAFSPDGRTLLAVGYGFEKIKDSYMDYHRVRLWDISSGEVTREFRGHSNSVLCVAFSPNGQYAVTGSRDRTAILWNVSEGKEVKLFDAHTDGVTAVAFTPDGSHVLTGSYDRTVRIWDVASGREARRFNLESYIDSISCTKNGRYALVGRRMPLEVYTGGTIDSNPVMLDLERQEIAKSPAGFRNIPLEDVKAVVSPDGRFVLYNAKQRSRVRGKDVDTFYLTLRELPE